MTTEIQPSKFNRRITVKAATTTTDDAGGTSTDDYTERFTTWASVESMSTNRKVYLGVDQFTSSYDIIFRYAYDRTLNTSDLIDYSDGGQTKTLSITGVQLVSQGYKQFNVVTANEVSVQG